MPAPTSFAWPGNSTSLKALPILKEQGIRLARRGGGPEHAYESGRGCAYQPGLDHPLLIPSAGDARPTWTLEDLKIAVAQAQAGSIAVLQFHGAPDTAHDWVSVSQSRFAEFMRYLKVNNYRVLALRDLESVGYVDPDIVPNNPWEVVEDRRRLEASQGSAKNSRKPADAQELAYWTENMRRHGFDQAEMMAATGLDANELESSPRKSPPNLSSKAPGAAGEPAQGVAGEPAPLEMLPYPGGRHPRIGFLDGAMRPQRDTKFSVFLPWDPRSYVVVDLPEAIWHRSKKPGKDGQGPGNRELLYLAHTHVPTRWSRQNIDLSPQEWDRSRAHELRMRRTLPNEATFGAEAIARDDGVVMKLWLDNQSDEHLSNLNVQNCVMLKQAAGFNERTVENKVFSAPFAACRDLTGKRWIITGWESCERAWGNEQCPCLHADPRLPDCPPGQRVELRGWLSFYEGDDIAAELARLKATQKF